MATNSEVKILGKEGTEQLVAKVKTLINEVNEVPASNANDEGKFLRVLNGAPTWSTVPNAEEGTF